MPTQKLLRCAVYTRKSTEHGLELEFNSLDAQREACEAYIKSQTSQGWRLVPRHYDDAAYSGGNLERPALKSLLKDIDAGKLDVVVVYKIDRLTRSLADFAKLVEIFDSKSISFVAVTQQFNTTTSMGRLTLNVLLSFAQFERELASERVRDKIAASRAKGKWTGGSVPLGYDVKDKKLVPNAAEQRTVRYIFERYLELKSFAKLVQDLDQKRIVSKIRKVAKTPSGVRFTFGPLAYLLKNRIYIGEIGHHGKWYPGEHQPIVALDVFERVQALLVSNAIERPKSRSRSGALLAGKLYDDRGNLMSPSFTVRNGVRYRFYVSAALLRGRKAEAGSLTRIAAKKIEEAVLIALRDTSETRKLDQVDLTDLIERVTASSGKLIILRRPIAGGPKAKGKSIEIPWSVPTKPMMPFIPTSDADTSVEGERLILFVARALAWLDALSASKFESIEALAASLRLHPKVVRQQIKFAFVNPTRIEAASEGRATGSLKQVDLSPRWVSSR